MRVADTKRDYYEILGVDRDADQKTIKRAFLKKARTLHPDVSDDPDAEEKFKEVNEAYSVLSDEQRRQNYDRFGDPDGPAGFGSSTVDVSDIFGGFGMDDIFSSFFGGQGRQGAAQRTRGRDMGMSLRISLQEAASGATKTIAYERLAPCDDCNASGHQEDGSIETCETCHGTGRVVSVQRTILGQMQTQSTCPDCQGTGKHIDKPCETCQGQGRVPQRETLEVEVPSGVYSGQEIKIAHKGEAGLRGDTSGDLIVRIDIEQHDVFQRSGDDLVCTQQIDSFEAMLGCQFSIDGILPDEQVEITIPAGVSQGQRVEVEGFGMPRYNSKARGKLVVIVDITTPTDLDDNEKKTLEDIAQAHGSRLVS